jgi:hypothetical protein
LKGIGIKLKGNRPMGRPRGNCMKLVSCNRNFYPNDLLMITGQISGSHGREDDLKGCDAM